MNQFRVALAFGSNLGDKEKNIAEALRLLRQNEFEILAVSKIITSAPVDCTADSGIFLNGVLTGIWSKSVESLLLLCQNIEIQLGRQKVRELNSPRTIDLDILLVENIQINHDDLQVPHLRMLERSFVMLPLAEIAPDWIVPGTNQKAGELAKRFS